MGLSRPTAPAARRCWGTDRSSGTEQLSEADRRCVTGRAGPAANLGDVMRKQ